MLLFSTIGYSQIKITDVNECVVNIWEVAELGGVASTQTKNNSFFVFYKNSEYPSLDYRQGFYFDSKDVDTVYNQIINTPNDKQIEIKLNDTYSIIYQ